MNEQNGTLCLIYKGLAGTEVLVGQSIMNITYGGNPIDISSKSDSDWANLLNDEITAQQITIAGTLTYNSDFTFESVKADAETGQHDKYIFRFGLTGDRVEGYFIPVNVTDSTTGGERVSTNVSFNSSDQVLSGGALEIIAGVQIGQAILTGESVWHNSADVPVFDLLPHSTAFSGTTYPLLAVKYPSLVTPVMPDEAGSPHQYQIVADYTGA